MHDGERVCIYKSYVGDSISFILTINNEQNFKQKFFHTCNILHSMKSSYAFLNMTLMIHLYCHTIMSCLQSRLFKHERRNILGTTLIVLLYLEGSVVLMLRGLWCGCGQCSLVRWPTFLLKQLSVSCCTSALAGDLVPMPIVLIEVVSTPLAPYSTAVVP